MRRSFLVVLLVNFLLVFLPMLAIDRFLVHQQVRTIEEKTRNTFQNMEDVLHRVRRNGRPQFLGKTIIDQAVFSIRRGEPILESIEKAIRPELNWEFFLFSPSGKPLPIGKKKTKGVTAWQRVMKALIQYRMGSRSPSNFEQKFAAQLLGDGSIFSSLSKSNGHFRKLPNSTRYTYGGWWFLRVGKSSRIKGHLLVFLKPGEEAIAKLWKNTVSVARKKCRAGFVLESLSEKEFPSEIRNSIKALGGIPGRFNSSQFFGVVGEVVKGKSLIAWRSKFDEHAFSNGMRPVLAVLGLFVMAWVFRFFLLKQILEVSLQIIVPVLILAATLPALAYLGNSMRDQREKIQNKEIYEEHRTIENSLRRIDVGFSQYLLKISENLQDLLEKYAINQDSKPLKAYLDSFGGELLSAYALNRNGEILHDFRSPKLDSNSEKKMLSTMFARVSGIIFGGEPGQGGDDHVFMYYLQNLGVFHETTVVLETRQLFVDLRSCHDDPSKIFGLVVSFNVSGLLDGYVRKLVRSPPDRFGIDLALVHYDEENLVQSVPRTFIQSTQGKRLAERSIEGNRTIDETIALNRGKKLVATVIQGKNLKGLILVGARSLENIKARDRALSLWTILTSTFVFLLAVFSSGALVNWLRDSFKTIRSGVDLIQAGQFHFSLEKSGEDEFAQLASGVEQAAITLEEIYSSRPVQEALVACKRVPGSGYTLDFFYEPGSKPCGDYLDAFEIPGGKHVLIIGETLGEGWQTTLVVAGIRMAIHIIMKRQNLPLPDLLDNIREHFKTLRGQIRFMTLWLGVLTPETGCLEWVAAGHASPLFYHRGKGEWLQTSGFPLGYTRKKKIEARRLQFEGGDRLVLLTNAWFRIRSAKKEQLDSKELLHFLEVNLAKPAQEIIPGVKQTILDHNFSLPVGDENSILLLSKNFTSEANDQ